jgi:hypothetical protein
MPLAYRALHHATERADFALTILELEEDMHGVAFSAHVADCICC